MTEPKIRIKYMAGDAVYEEKKTESPNYSLDLICSDEGVKLKIKPKREMTLISVALKFEHIYEETEMFFMNGYQSWSTSAELGKDDTFTGELPISNITKKTADMAKAAGDYGFTRYDGRKGSFHSFTYTYLRRGDIFELYGSLSERTGYTIFYCDMEKNCFSIEKDVEGLTINEPYELFDVVRFEGEYEYVFDRYFERMNLPKRAFPALSGYTSWYNYFQAIDEKTIVRDLEGMSAGGDTVNIFQIDDGYERHIGDWLDYYGKYFPNGMKYLADLIHKQGYKAGIWLAPFNVQKKSNTFKDNPDWIIRDKNKKPQLGCAAWGGAYTIDIYNPEVRQHLKHIFDVILNDWHYDMVKLDFLYSQCITPRDNKTRGQIMCESMDFLRECVGDKLILGCGVPLGPAFGKVDACRIGCDVALSYNSFIMDKMKPSNEVPNAKNAINNTLFRRHLDGRAFSNDPDVFFLRRKNLNFTREQKLLLAKINNLCGNVLFVSDNAGEYDDIQTHMLKKTLVKTDAKVIDVKCINGRQKGDYAVKYIENGEEKCLCFNIKTGKSNILDLIK